MCVGVLQAIPVSQWLGLLRSRGRRVTYIYPELSVVSVIITYSLNSLQWSCLGYTSNRLRLSRVREKRRALQGPW